VKRILPALILAAIPSTAGALPATAASSATSKISIRILSAGPKTVHPVFSKKHGWRNCVVTFSSRVTGVKLTSNISKKPKPGKGNIEIFGAKIPKAAYSHAEVAPYWLEELGTAVFAYCVHPGVYGGKGGKYTLLIAIGKTNGVLYQGVTPARFTVTVK
jgi:hypothetical protein